jgi:hypothetical protein
MRSFQRDAAYREPVTGAVGAIPVSLLTPVHY